MSIASLTRHSDAAPLTAFDYLYRDAGNFKARGTIIVSGELPDGWRAQIVGTMESGEFFVAEQVGVPALYDQLFCASGGRTPSDHAWHSFEGFRQVTDGAAAAIWGSARELLMAFERVGEWDISMSPNYLS